MAGEFRQARMASGEIVEVPAEKAEAFRNRRGFVAFVDEDPALSPGDEELVPVETGAGTIWMKPSTERRTRANREVDDLAAAWDDLMGGLDATSQEPQSMNGQQGGEFPPDVMAVIQQYAQEGRLHELFQPFQQEQGVLDQEMALAQQFGQQRGPQRASPTGALLGGLSGALRGVGGAAMQKKNLDAQAALGKRMQGDATARNQALLEMYQKRMGIDPKTGLRGTAVDDAALAEIMGGAL